MENTQGLIGMRSTGFNERLDKNSTPCQGRDQISGGGTFDPPEVTVAWGGEEVGGGEWLGLGEWVGWRVGEMVGRRGVGVCNTQPQPRYYTALVTPASLCYGSDLRLCYVSPTIETWSPGSRDGGNVFSWGNVKN